MKHVLPTVNYHLLKSCNMQCKFCYATFDDIKSRRLSPEQDIALLQQLADAGLFRKINFAGGEPTLLPHLKSLIFFAKSLGFETSLVTNASRIDVAWLEDLGGVLDILTISLDSADASINIASGRHEKGAVTPINKIKALAQAAHNQGIYLKINTVVHQLNQAENLYPLINELAPQRWKVLQVTRIEQQNDSQFAELAVSSAAFAAYCSRNQKGLNVRIKFVPEASDIIQGSYLMIDQLGRFYDSSAQCHNYSQRILEVGVGAALSQISPNYEKFVQRGGLYSALPNPLK